MNDLDGDYEKATDLYTKGIEIHPDAILYSNRSFAYLRREWYGYALIDAKKALEYDSKYIKVFPSSSSSVHPFHSFLQAFYRRASSYMALGKYTLALSDYEYVSVKNCFGLRWSEENLGEESLSE